MTPEKLFHELLGLGLNWEVIESRFERASGTVFLEIRETSKLWALTRCPQAGGFVFCYDHTEVLTWRHLNVFQHRCEITCRLPRGNPGKLCAKICRTLDFLSKSGCPTWIRTMNNASKERCVTITPSDKPARR